MVIVFFPNAVIIINKNEKEIKSIVAKTLSLNKTRKLKQVDPVVSHSMQGFSASCIVQKTSSPPVTRMFIHLNKSE